MKGVVDIRSATLTEVEQIMPIMADAFDQRFGESWTKEQVKGMMILPGTQLIIASIQAEWCGFSLFHTVLEDSELLLIGVGKKWQGKGVGFQLLQNTMRTSCKNGAHRLLLEVREGNQAVEFYLRNNFHQIGKRENYYICDKGFTAHALTMCIDLGAAYNLY